MFNVCLCLLGGNLRIKWGSGAHVLFRFLNSLFAGEPWRRQAPRPGVRLQTDLHRLPWEDHTEPKTHDPRLLSNHGPAWWE